MQIDVSGVFRLLYYFLLHICTMTEFNSGANHVDVIINKPVRVIHCCDGVEEEIEEIADEVEISPVKIENIEPVSNEHWTPIVWSTQ